MYNISYKFRELLAPQRGQKVKFQKIAKYDEWKKNKEANICINGLHLLKKLLNSFAYDME